MCWRFGATLTLTSRTRADVPWIWTSVSKSFPLFSILWSKKQRLREGAASLSQTLCHSGTLFPGTKIGAQIFQGSKKCLYLCGTPDSFVRLINQTSQASDASIAKLDSH